MNRKYEENEPTERRLFALARTFLRDIKPDERIEALKCAAAQRRIPYDSATVRRVVDTLETEWRRQLAAFERGPGPKPEG